MIFDYKTCEGDNRRCSPRRHASHVDAMRLIISLSLVCALVAADENKTKPSTLAPSIPYLDVWAFLHSKDTDKPKVLYIPKLADEDADAKDPPSWLTSAARGLHIERVWKGSLVHGAFCNYS